MTSNQIAYQQAKENQRHNRVVEALTAEKNHRDYVIAKRNLKETQRANKAKESENTRTNLAREFETNRSNLENERLKELSNVVVSDHYIRSDDNNLTQILNDYAIKRNQLAESKRSNVAQENLSKSRNDIQMNSVATQALSKANPLAGAAYATSGHVQYDLNNGTSSNLVTGATAEGIRQLTPLAKDLWDSVSGVFNPDNWKRTQFRPNN